MSELPAYSLYEKIYLVVQQVPPGRVASYGDIAYIVGGGCTARSVGFALSALPRRRDQEVPWQRIINKAGRISTHGARQRQLLEAEGIVFDADGRTDFKHSGWRGPDPAWAAEHGFNPLPNSDNDPDATQLQMF